MKLFHKESGGYASALDDDPYLQFFAEGGYTGGLGRNCVNARQAAAFRMVGTAVTSMPSV